MARCGTFLVDGVELLAHLLHPDLAEAPAGIGFECFDVSATATSGLPVVFTTDPSSNGVCSVSGSTVSFSGRGTCIIYADQPGDANYLPAPQEQQVFKVKNHTPG